jgi:hypothetical protein
MNARISVLRLLVVVFSLAVCLSSARADQTPETRTLTAEEAARTLQRDWLFQAMGEPLADRAAQEIGWARELAERLGSKRPAPDLSAELGALDRLEARLAELADRPAEASPAARADPVPSWIWYPEGSPVKNAPAESRFFRRRFEPWLPLLITERPVNNMPRLFYDVNIFFVIGEFTVSAICLLCRQRCPLACISELFDEAGCGNADNRDRYEYEHGGNCRECRKRAFSSAR